MSTERQDDGNLLGLGDISSVYAPYLERVRWMLQRYTMVINVVDSAPADATLASHIAFRGMSGQRLPESLQQPFDNLSFRLQESYESIAQRGQGPGISRFERVRREFGLDDLQCDALWLLCAAELLAEFLWLLRTLWADKERLHADRIFLSHVLDPQSRRLSQVFAALDRSSVLVAHRLLVELEHDIDDERVGKLAASHMLLRYLSGFDGGVPNVAGVRAVHEPVEESQQGLPHPTALDFAEPELKKRLQHGFSRQRRFLLYGSDNTAPLQLARDVMNSQDVPLIEADCQELLASGEGALVTLLGEAKLRRAGIFLDRVEALAHKDADPMRVRRFFELLAAVRIPQFHRVSYGISPSMRLRFARSLDCVELRLKPPEPETRGLVWRSRLAAYLTEPALEQVAFAARVYPFGISEIDDAIQIGWLQAQQRKLIQPTMRAADIEYACQSMASQRIEQYAQRVSTSATWDDVVLTDETQTVIDEIVRFGRHAKQIFEDQGYGAKMGYGKGLTALFYGPPGTGKTMISGLLARELGLELYRVELSQIVSKYIGETEQRLSEIFDEAEATGMAILFDEADSLFAKRTEVKTSVDRYANLEVNFLLQRIESHDGVVIMTTNFPSALDEAFMRRIRFKAEFPAPGPEERRRLWLAMIPANAPREPELDLEDLAEVYEMTGGEIRNAVLRAAFYAVDEGAPLGLRHLEKSARVEYREAGRLMPPPLLPNVLED